MFQAVTLRARSAQTDPESLARLYSSRAEAEDAEWRRTHVRMDDGTFESARQLDETLNAELDALTSAVEDNAAALKLRDVDLVSKLLDDVLIENGLTIPSHRRREFALALLQAHLKSLEVSVKRTKAEIAGERQEDQGVTVDGHSMRTWLEGKLRSATSPLALRDCVDRTRLIYEEIAEDCATRGATVKSLSLPPPKSSFAPWRILLVEADVLTKDEGELFQKLYGDLSDVGTHRLGSAPEHVRLTKNVVIEVCLLLVGRVQALSTTPT